MSVICGLWPAASLPVLSRSCGGGGGCRSAASHARPAWSHSERPELRGVSEEEAGEARATIEAHERESDQSGASLFLNGHLLYPWQHALATKAAVLDMVEDLIGPNLLIWKCQLWVKEPCSGSHVGWHQDASYWGLEPPDCVNVWMALTNVTSEHGPMQLLKGSHVEPLMEHEDRYEPDNLLTRGQVIAHLQDGTPGPDPAQTVSAVLRPGEFSLHHLCTAHGGGPNNGDDRRIGFNVTYVPPSVRSLRPDGAFAMLVRGEDTHGHFELESPPEAGGSGAGREQYAAKMEGLARSIMHDADLAKFAEVSERRVGKNLPSHVSGEGAGAAGTSLASSLLKQQEA